MATKKKPNRLGDFIRRCRKERGWSIDELAFRSHVRPRLISGYERGEYDPGSRNLSAILRALGLPLPWEAGDSKDSSTARDASLADWGALLPPSALAGIAT